MRLYGYPDDRAAAMHKELARLLGLPRDERQKLAQEAKDERARVAQLARDMKNE
jgi:hypothetical protein